MFVWVVLNGCSGPVTHKLEYYSSDHLCFASCLQRSLRVDKEGQFLSLLILISRWTLRYFSRVALESYCWRVVLQFFNLASFLRFILLLLIMVVSLRYPVILLIIALSQVEFLTEQQCHWKAFTNLLSLEDPLVHLNLDLSLMILDSIISLETIWSLSEF